MIDMNILSKTYTDAFEDINHFLDKASLVSLNFILIIQINIILKQNTNVGAGCAAAFYFNYYKLLSPLSGKIKD